MATVSTEFIVVAIDIGTSYSGYAFSYKADYQRNPLDVQTNKWNGKGLSNKTSSVILLNPDKTFNSFGFDAENTIVKMAEDGMPQEELEQYYYIDSFKMKLYKNKDDCNTVLEVEDIFGKSVSLLLVMELSIRFLKDKLLDFLNSRGMQTFVEDVRWVLTVPAVWTDQAKEIMRECASKAGIPPTKLILAYEPEVAALYCKQLPDEKISGSSGDAFERGSKIMVVDLGGGTADFTVQEISENDRMRSIFSVSGGPWGGSRVNAEFISFLIELFGNEVIRQLQKNAIMDYLDIIREFEMKKRDVKLSSRDDVRILIPQALREQYEKFNNCEFATFFSTHNPPVKSQGVIFKRDKMHIKFTKFETFFKATICKILQHLQKLMEELSNDTIAAILMVGGFAECPLLNERVKQEFPSHRVITPIGCDLAVLTGAVIYGHRPETIAARYCSYTIGINLNKDYDSEVHAGGSTYKSGGKLKCANCFEIFFSKGEIINTCTKRSNSVHSDHRSEEQRKWKYDVKEIEIFTSQNSHPKFVNEPGCRRHAMLTVNPPGPQKVWPDVVDGRIEMEAGGTELIVRYIDEQSGEETETKLNSFDLLGSTSYDADGKEPLDKQSGVTTKTQLDTVGLLGAVKLISSRYNVAESSVVPCLRLLDEKEILIVYDVDFGHEKSIEEFGHEILFRNPQIVDKEAADVLYKFNSIKYPIEKNTEALLRKAIEEHSKSLFYAHSNLNIIGMSPVKSKQGGEDVTEHPCVVLYCTAKGYIPKGEKPFPLSLTVDDQNVTVDVREGYFHFTPYSYPSFKSDDFHPRLKMGCQFGNNQTNFCGTVGPFVKHGNGIGFLTCAHIVAGTDLNGYDMTYQPFSRPRVEQPDSRILRSPSYQTNGTSYQCGEVTRAIFRPQDVTSVDVALVLVTEMIRAPLRGEFAIDSYDTLKNAGFDDLPRFESGRIHTDPSTIDNDKRIVKFGAATHVTKGVLSSYGTSVKALSENLQPIDQVSGPVYFKKQLEVYSIHGHSAFFMPGDSGAGVFYADKTPTGGQELTCIGLAIGCTSYGSAIVTPIAAVLEALQLPLTSLKVFP